MRPWCVLPSARQSLAIAAKSVVLAVTSTDRLWYGVTGVPTPGSVTAPLPQTPSTPRRRNPCGTLPVKPRERQGKGTHCGLGGRRTTCAAMCALDCAKPCGLRPRRVRHRTRRHPGRRDRHRSDVSSDGGRDPSHRRADRSVRARRHQRQPIVITLETPSFRQPSTPTEGAGSSRHSRSDRHRASRPHTVGSSRSRRTAIPRGNLATTPATQRGCTVSNRPIRPLGVASQSSHATRGRPP